MKPEEIQVTQHAIDRFVLEYLGDNDPEKAHRLYADEYYIDLIRFYLSDAIEIQMPIHVQVEKALRYGDPDGQSFFLNRSQKILFVISADNVLLTIHCPYDDSKRFAGKTPIAFRKKKK